MASFLRKIVAGPRAPHPEANLDLCYVTDNIIATSGPAVAYPTRAYRNPLPQLVRWLDDNHGADWAIWEFRAEGTGYPDKDVYGRILHFPWPDHHPPPFHLIPHIMASMRDWTRGKDLFNTRATDEDNKNADASRRVIVVHCKAGKGRSGSMAVSYLLSHEGWSRSDALQRFTDRRMRPGFGAGVSIPSQLRWIGYVERWAANGKLYVDQRIQVTEVHVWGLRDGAKLSIEGYVHEGKKIKTFHVFGKSERDDLRQPGDVDADPAPDIAKTETHDETADAPHVIDVVADVVKRRLSSKPSSQSTSRTPSKTRSKTASADDNTSSPADAEAKTSNTIFRPAIPIFLPTNDVSLACERRANASYNWLMVTSVAHVWFNCFFEGDGPENLAKQSTGAPDQSGVFHVVWDHMDGIKGSSKKGTRAFDRAAVVWRVAPSASSDAADTPSASDAHPAPGSGEVLQDLRRQATERSERSNAPAATATTADDGADTNTRAIAEPASPAQAQPADWRGTDPVREDRAHDAHEGSPMAHGLGLRAHNDGDDEDDRHAVELEKAADSDEDGVDGIQRGVTAVVGDAIQAARDAGSAVLGYGAGNGGAETHQEKGQG